VETYSLSQQQKQDHQLFVGAVKRLQSLGDIISAELKQTEGWVLTTEGVEMAKNGSHEFNVFTAIKKEGLLQADLQKLPLGKNAKIGFSKAMSEGWLSIDKNAMGGPRIFRKTESVTDHVKENLNKVKDGQTVEENKLNELKKRKLVSKEVIKSYILKKGSDFKLNVQKAETDLTPEMLASGSWKTKSFKEYNFDALGIMPSSGHLHPLLKVRTQYRQIFLEMGFSEMPTNNFVENSFWNFDALFQPQQHPARDAHGTFFISDPMFSSLKDVPENYLEKVKKV
jgi:phenylalanyl-tRNA synthetase alpha chain